MLTRRRFLQLAGTGVVAATTLRWQTGCGDNIVPIFPARFFDEHQWNTIDLATAQVVPGIGTDDGTGVPSNAPGARDANVINYIDILLGAFDVVPPAIFASGPASGRQAQPDPTTGAPTTTFPPDAFATYLPLSRVREIAWRMRLYGSTATAGGTFNDAVLGVTPSMRDQYVAGVVALDAAAAALVAGANYVDLAPADQASAFNNVQVAQPAFYQLLLGHVLEGMFAAPEYGGNLNLVGWKLAHYDGDSIPLGHSFYDPATSAYIDRVDQPTSTATPGAVTETFSDDIVKLLTLAAVGSGGQKFF